MYTKSLMTAGALAAGLLIFTATAGRTQPPAPAAGPAPDGAALFTQVCSGCHTREAKQGTDIVAALTSGIMQPVAVGAGLNTAQIQAIANYINGVPAPAATAPGGRGGGAEGAPGGRGGAAGAPGGRGGGAPGGRGGAAAGPALVDKMCDGPAPAIVETRSDWPMVGHDLRNTRYQPNSGIRPGDVKKLKVKWSMSVTGHRNAQPIVVGDWMWFAANGQSYALDPKTGCVRWKLDAQANGLASRNSPPVFKNSLSPSGWMMIVAPTNRVVKALDARDGKTLWTSEVLETASGSGLLGSAVVSGNQVFVPMTSGQEGQGGRAGACCTFRGSLVALDLATGRTQWKSYTITEPMRQVRLLANGAAITGPTGGAIWSAATPDPKRGLVYVATGDSYTDAPTKGTDAIIAFDMKTGVIKWNTQVTENDNYVMNCNSAAAIAAARAGTNNCPQVLGPDFDFGASPILFKAGNREVLVSGQKSSIVYGMDPDTGRILWQHQTGQGSALGGIEWGIASDNRYVFAGNSDVVNMMDEVARLGGKDNPSFAERQPPAKPSLTAFNPVTGRVVWQVVPPKAPCNRTAAMRPTGDGSVPCFNAMSGSPAAMPGVVFEGTVDGWFRAYNSANGRLLWEDSTSQRTYSTINGRTNQPGGSIDGNGPTIAAGMVFVTSGYNGAIGQGGNGTNVLIAYSVDGK